MPATPATRLRSMSRSSTTLPDVELVELARAGERGAFDEDPPRDRGRPSYDPHDEPPDDEEEGPLPGRFGGGHR